MKPQPLNRGKWKRTPEHNAANGRRVSAGKRRYCVTIATIRPHKPFSP